VDVEFYTRYSVFRVDVEVSEKRMIFVILPVLFRTAGICGERDGRCCGVRRAAGVGLLTALMIARMSALGAGWTACWRMCRPADHE
jgi:hypothetical protein